MRSARYESPNELIRDKTYDDGHRYRQRSQDYRIGPLRPVQPVDCKGFASDKDDQDLTSHNDELDADKEVIMLNSFKDVELVVNAAAAV